jgi:hypothetical protein
MKRVLKLQIPNQERNYLTVRVISSLKEKNKCTLTLEKNMNQRIAACESEQ